MRGRQPLQNMSAIKRVLFLLFLLFSHKKNQSPEITCLFLFLFSLRTMFSLLHWRKTRKILVQ